MANMIGSVEGFNVKPDDFVGYDKVRPKLTAEQRPHVRAFGVRDYVPEMFEWLDDPDRRGEYFVQYVTLSHPGGKKHLSDCILYFADQNLAFEFKIVFG